MAELLSRRRRRGASALAVAALLALGPREASAQLHWDASAQVGVMKRVLTRRQPGAEDAGFGPTGQLTGHVALLPLIHAGGYFGHDISPMPGDAAARNITFGGARVKGILPWLRGSTRTWVFAGFGYAGVYAPSYATTFAIVDGDGTSARRPVRVAGAGGGFFEVPFGIGASYRLFKPWELSAELGARAGFGHSGTVYEAPGPGVTVPDGPSQRAAPAGLDRFAVGLTVGVMIDL
ncbi:MAG: hypothetical protein KF795_04770 [Labilithrix sp.]|nr:hypothetical protein [Labilithrix sp.]